VQPSTLPAVGGAGVDGGLVVFGGYWMNPWSTNVVADGSVRRA